MLLPKHVAVFRCGGNERQRMARARTPGIEQKMVECGRVNPSLSKTEADVDFRCISFFLAVLGQ
jgi:hypothetical protein